MISSTPTGKGTVKSTSDTKSLLSLASPTSRKNKIFFVIITFFTILRAAWLLHPSQLEKQSCDLDNYSSIKPITTPTPHLPLVSTLTMALSATTEIKNTLSINSLASKHRRSQQQKKQVTGSTPSTPFKIPGTNIIAATVKPSSM